MAELTSLHLDRLRFAAALVHAVPQAAIELRGVRGTPLIVSHDRSLSPDLSPCEFAAMIGRISTHGDAILEFGWLSDIVSVEIGGKDLFEDGTSIAVVNPSDGRRLTAFTTTLDADEVMTSARALAQDFIAEDTNAIAALSDVQVRVEHDQHLGVSVVLMPWSAKEDIDDALQLSTAIAQRCLVDELVASAVAAPLQRRFDR